MATASVLDRFSPAVRAWFTTTFPAATAAQERGFAHITTGEHTLIAAPTGSGKTLAAFLVAIDRLVSRNVEESSATRVLYISPLRALAFDVEKNLRSPIVGIRHAAERLGEPFREPLVAMRTGDTSARDRQRMLRNPPDILITTPESLYLMLTSSARTTLANVDTIIIDEIHAVAATKRGAHLALSLERLEQLTARSPQRIGLSATQRPLEEVARFLGGFHDGSPRPVAIVDAGARKAMEIEVVVPVEDMGEIGKVTQELRSGPATAAAVERRTSIWPSITPRILDLVQQHRSTIIFCNARRGAERLAAQLNELAVDLGLGDGEYVKAHHGSLAREQRIVIEDQLKRGQLRAIVATSSLELGIDMGAVDLVIQVESPGAVSRGLQRIGRAGHSVGEASRGKVFPKHRHDLLEVAVVAQRMMDAEIESTRYLRNPLDVLAQHIVAHVAMHPDCTVASLTEMIRRCANFAELSDEVRNNVLDLLSGRYPSEEFRDLKPRIVWDRIADTLRARDGAQRLAVTNGGTIPDRGMFGVFLPDGTRVGELDEEMVYETRPGETFVLGASTWRIEDVSFDRVIVIPAPGEPGKMPFWHGDRLGRPLELGRAVGQFLRTIRDEQVQSPGLDDTGLTGAERTLTTRHCLDPLAARNLLAYVDEQVEATGTLPDDRTIVIERFRDEIGDWRVCIHSPFGTPVHAPWAIALEQRLLERLGIPVETMWGDDGIVLRLPEAVDRIPVEELLIDPDDITDALVAAVPQTALFAARFRECAARALLLPRRRPDQRTPLWQQRQRAADLLAVAAKYPSFPILLETSRECLQDVFDVPALRDVLTQLRSRSIRLVSVDTPKASPFAQSLLFNWIAAYMYEGDAPLAERRAAALALDRDLLNDLLGSEELRELLDGEVLADIELELQHVAESRRATTVDELHDVLRRVGDLSLDELSLRFEGDVEEGINTLVGQRRAIDLVVAGERRFVAAEDAARFRDAIGCALPLGLPQAFTEPVASPLRELVGRFARTHAPFVARDVATRFGVSVERIVVTLAELEGANRLVRGEFRPFGTEREWCDTEVLRLVRRRSLAKLRKEVEPVDQRTFARFLSEWHGITAPMHGSDALAEALTALSGAALVASTLETDVLPLRVRGYRASMLDDLCTSGEVVWVGAGSLGGNDGRIRLFFADQLGVMLPALEPLDAPEGAVHDRVRAALDQRGASFWGQLRAGVTGATDSELLAALWDLVWSGEVTNDSLTPLRAVLLGARSGKSARSLPVTGGARRAAARLVRPRHVRGGSTSRVGPPAAQGRWSLVTQLVDQRATTTQSMHGLAMQLLERHGVVTREAVLAEHVRGGFAGVYGVLKALEERGTVRRGYFVDGLGAAQFAVPGAVDRLRACKEDHIVDATPTAPDSESTGEVMVLAATDPAQPYGASIDWPPTEGRPVRSAGALVLLMSGEVLGWYDVRSHHLVTFTHSLESTNVSALVEALGSLVKDGRTKSVEIRKINGAAFGETSPMMLHIGALLEQRKFVRGYRGWVLRD